MDWDWETFPQWLDSIDRRPKGINVMSFVPLNPLMIYVMGAEAAKSRDPYLRGGRFVAKPSNRARMS
jgi:N-acyl-D-aspartate/D-glutamate deacylase